MSSELGPVYQISVISKGHHTSAQDALACPDRVVFDAAEIAQTPWAILAAILAATADALKRGYVVVMVSTTPEDFHVANAMLDRYVLAPCTVIH